MYNNCCYNFVSVFVLVSLFKHKKVIFFLLYHFPPHLTNLFCFSLSSHLFYLNRWNHVAGWCSIASPVPHLPPDHLSSSISPLPPPPSFFLLSVSLSLSSCSPWRPPWRRCWPSLTRSWAPSGWTAARTPAAAIRWFPPSSAPCAVSSASFTASLVSRKSQLSTSLDKKIFLYCSADRGWKRRICFDL